MEKLIKITGTKYPEIYNDSCDKYIFVNDKKDILGIATIDNSVKVNKIKISILDEYRGNGYGKMLFQKLIEEYKSNYNDINLRFEVNDENRINSILYRFGGINISNNNGKLLYILPVNRKGMKWR